MDADIATRIKVNLKICICIKRLNIPKLIGSLYVEGYSKDFVSRKFTPFLILYYKP